MIDITNPAAPAIVDRVRTPGGAASGIAVAGSHAYLADGPNLQVLDLTNPASPIIIGSVVMPAGAEGVAVAGATVCIAAQISGLVIIPAQCTSLP